MNKITRSTVNEQQYSAPEMPKSGFPLSYRRYSSFLLGRLHVGGFHFVMPGDKISGLTRGNNLTFKRLVTPIVSPVNGMQYNIFIPFRPLDRTFQKGITPTKLNDMSANWSAPTINTRTLVASLLGDDGYGASIAYNKAGSLDVNLLDFFTMLADGVVGGSFTLSNMLSTYGYTTNQAGFSEFLYDSTHGIVTRLINALTANGEPLTLMADNLYLRDALIDIADNISKKLGSLSNPLSFSLPINQFFYLLMDCTLTPFLGRYSYFGEFKYEFIRPWDLYRIANGIVKSSPYSFELRFSNTPMNEYPIRAMYAIWYELFRNVDLEPVSNTLPDWREFGSTSILDISNGGNLLYLIYRIRSWEKDMFISAQIDDLSRHVYAPIYANNNNTIAGHVQRVNNEDANPTSDPTDSSTGGSLASLYTLTYRDQLTDFDVSIACPVPANVNDSLSALDKTFFDVYGLDLNSLRQSQMLERYLKRNYLFGDEYQDRMLAHYNSRVSDMRINRPEVLSQSMNGYNMGQQVSNVSTDETKVGDRTATATLDLQGEPYTTFAEEFGILISLVCFMPRGMYDGTTPQLLMQNQTDFPIPEFASNNEEFGRKLEIAGSSLENGYLGDAQNNNYMFGRYPAYHAWRGRVDEVGGDFLDELQDCTFRRFFGMFSDDTTPKLNYFFIHCRPNLNMFANNNLYDAQIYGDLVHECYVERVLPTPVEVI